MAAERERRIPKRYSDELFSTGLLLRKKTRTKPTTVNFHPVVVTAVDKVAKREKIHHVEIFRIFFGDTCSFTLSLRALPQVSFAW